MISVGDDVCMLMERPESARYLPRAGKWKWRQTLTMAKHVDLVIGAETGVLNAAGCFDTPKITFLSHSKHENLCQYWKNDYCLAPEDTFCHPCHILHYVHPIGQMCSHCGLEHTEQDGASMKYGEGMWSCPYIDVGIPGVDAAPFPYCMASGIHPDRVVAQIKKVHAQWLRKKESKDLVAIT